MIIKIDELLLAISPRIIHGLRAYLEVGKKKNLAAPGFFFFFFFFLPTSRPLEIGENTLPLIASVQIKLDQDTQRMLLV